MTEVGITCLIPAFKIKYVGRLFTGLIKQKAKPVRVILSDDTPDNSFLAWFQERQSDLKNIINVEVHEGPKKGHYENIEFLISLYRKKRTSHFHILCDDDQIFPDFYNQHIKTHSQKPSMCSVSRRWVTNEAGWPLYTPDLPTSISNLDQRSIEIGGKLLASSYIEDRLNWLGELSFAVFDMNFLGHHEQFHYYGDIPLVGLNDIGSFLKASFLGRLVLIDNYLGASNRNSDSFSGTKGFIVSLAVLGKLNFAIMALNNKVLTLDLLRKAIEDTIRLWQYHYGENWVLRKLSSLLEIFDNAGVNAFIAEFRKFHTFYYQESSHLANCYQQEQLIAALQNEPG